MGMTAAGGSTDLTAILLTEEQIAARVATLAEQLAQDYQGKCPLLIGVLKGSIVFLADLIRKMGIPLEIDLICVSSYGCNAQSSGRISLLKDVAADLTGRHVVLVEDIIDSGLTVAWLLETLRERQPASLAVVCLLNKPDRREVDVPINYTGFEIPDEFVVGYGLDFAEQYRYLPHVAVLRSQVP